MDKKEVIHLLKKLLEDDSKSSRRSRSRSPERKSHRDYSRPHYDTSYRDDRRSYEHSSSNHDRYSSRSDERRSRSPVHHYRSRSPVRHRSRSPVRHSSRSNEHSSYNQSFHTQNDRSIPFLRSEVKKNQHYSEMSLTIISSNEISNSSIPKERIKETLIDGKIIREYFYINSQTMNNVEKCVDNYLRLYDTVKKFYDDYIKIFNNDDIIYFNKIISKIIYQINHLKSNHFISLGFFEQKYEGYIKNFEISCRYILTREKINLSNDEQSFDANNFLNSVKDLLQKEKISADAAPTDTNVANVETDANVVNAATDANAVNDPNAAHVVNSETGAYEVLSKNLEELMELRIQLITYKNEMTPEQICKIDERINFLKGQIKFY